MLAQSSYRPHNPGNDYYAPGIYLITLVVRGREPLLGCLNMDVRHPGVELTDVGKAVEECWNLIPKIQAEHRRKITVHNSVCMPDHFHGIIEVNEHLDVNVGEVIRGFKAGCTMAWHNLIRPSMVEEGQSMADEKSAVLPYLEERELLKRLSKRQRAEYYEQHPDSLRPLFDDNYDDTICLSSLGDDGLAHYDQRHLSAMLHYVDDNPRRAIIRRLHPDFMRRCQHIVIAGRDYAAFGNLFLLRWSRKVQVFCHRKAPDGSTPYEKTEEYISRCREWKRQLMEGQTVMVTPGISMGERIIKDRCIESCYPLIHIQKEPIGQYWKPEKRRFEACENGTLLILAPWHPEGIGEVKGVPSGADYSFFHNMNDLAKEICDFADNIELRIKGK